MTRIELHEIQKSYGDLQVVKPFSLKVEDKAFISFLGSSGCGKTTTLRMIAGLETPSGGEIYLDDRLIYSHPKSIFVPPEHRHIGMVFQSYAIWPHMTVFQNVAYPLRIQKKSPAEIRTQVAEMLELVQLDRLADRYPHQLSGGQQQRVALARALIMRPGLLLLDEPLSNLDAKLREDMRLEIKNLQRRFAITVIYVTHDQSEALVMSDRIVVIHQGEIQQIDTPMSIYRFPANRFVADFIGSNSFLPAKVLRRDDRYFYALLEDGMHQNTVKIMDRGGELSDLVWLSVRPEDISIHDQGPLEGVVKSRTFLGDRIDYWVDIGQLEIRVTTPSDQLIEEGDDIHLEIRHAVPFTR